MRFCYLITQLDLDYTNSWILGCVISLIISVCLRYFISFGRPKIVGELPWLIGFFVRFLFCIIVFNTFPDKNWANFEVLLCLVKGYAALVSIITLSLLLREKKGGITGPIRL